MRAAVILAGLATVAAITPARAADCLTFETTATLAGKIAAVEDYWILRVSPAICVELPPGDDLGAPAYNVQEVQIVVEQADAAKALAGQAVIATGHLAPPHEGANKRPVILEIESLKKK